MSHNLLIQNGQASMFYIDDVPWHGLGTRLDQPATALEAIQAANLDWKVVKLPLFAGSKRIAVPDRFAVVRRTADLIQKTDPVLGAVIWSIWPGVVGLLALIGLARVYWIWRERSSCA